MATVLMAKVRMGTMIMVTVIMMAMVMAMVTKVFHRQVCDELKGILDLTIFVFSLRLSLQQLHAVLIGVLLHLSFIRQDIRRLDEGP